jgi:oligopeptidase B
VENYSLEAICKLSERHLKGIYAFQMPFRCLSDTLFKEKKDKIIILMRQKGVKPEYYYINNFLYRISFMKYFLLVILPVMALIESGLSQQIITKEPPEAKKERKELTIHGHTRIDNYFWLNQKDDPAVIKYLEDENSYTDEVLGHTKKLQERLFNEITGRIKQDDQSVPYFDNGYYYFVRFEEGKEYPLYCRKKGSLDSEEEIMLNVNEMAKGFNYYSIGAISVSPDNKLIAFGVDTLSRRKFNIYFKNLETGEIYSDILENTTGGAAWTNDNKTVFYTSRDHTLRSYKIFRHTLGEDPQNDKEIFHEDDETYSTFVYRSKSDQYIFIGSFSTVATEYRFLNTDDPSGEFSLVQPRERDHEYSIDHFGNKFYIVTNLDARNFRLMETPVSDPSMENWKEIIPHRKEVLLEGMEIFRNFLVIQERKNGLTQLRIKKWGEPEEHYLDFGEETYTAYISTNREFDTDILRFGYTSLTTPNSTFDYNMINREKSLLKQEEVIGGYDPSEYHSERLYAQAEDGIRIPISIVYKRGVSKNGNNPLLLYGYGSYGITQNPSFSSVRLSLLDRGFIFAIAHIRGGQEMGRQWYDDGKLLNKKNTFTDFIACAEFLIENDYTSSEKIFASGGSAGGLLVGAVANMRPDLFKGILAAVPFVDIVTTMLDTSIPLTTGEYDEWGNPNEKEYYDYILSYSPYDNVEPKNYPAMLVTTGLHDSQVQYWEPAKWVAKLREMKTDNNPLLLHTQMTAGHSGASGRFERYRITALQYAFMLSLLGHNS